MGQGPQGYIVHPTVGIGPKGALIDSARGFGQAFVPDPPYGFPGLGIIEIIEQDSMDSRGFKDFIHFRQIPGLDDNLKVPVVFPEVLLRLLDGTGDSSRKVDMVVLEHDHIVKGEPMVLPAPDLDRPFFKGPNPRGGLPGIQNLGPRTLEQGDTVPGLGGYGTLALHRTEHQTLPLEASLGTNFHLQVIVLCLDATAYWCLLHQY